MTFLCAATLGRVAKVVSGDAPSVDAMKDAGRANVIADARLLTAKISVQIMMPRKCSQLTKFRSPGLCNPPPGSKLTPHGVFAVIATRRG